jgi:predicted 3-demethylubiquinone-9 3-methyltransferase (glyoxalase superfamily)
LTFVGDLYGKAEEAVEFYVTAFEGARLVELERFGTDEHESGLKRATFTLAERDFIANGQRERPPLLVHADDLAVRRRRQRGAARSDLREAL